MNNFTSYIHNQQFTLENGETLPGLEIAYHTFGKLNQRKDNVVWVCHALTASSDVFEWWKGLFGDDNLFNPEEHYIVCANVLGSHYGTTSPLSKHTESGQPYYNTFPRFTIRDMVNAHILLADHLQIPQIALLIGGSLGGQQCVEWAITEPRRIKNLVLIATNAFHSPWGIAFNESQRMAISTDPTFYSQTPDGGCNGLKTARSIALLSYRSYETYGTSQQEFLADKTDDFKASSYQNYQGEKLVNRFNAYSYWYLSKAMDSHNVGRNRGTIEEALNRIQAKTLVIAITSDLLFPPEEQRFLAKHINNARFVEMSSFYGHDGFLIETEILSREIDSFLKSSSNERMISMHKIA